MSASIIFLSPDFGAFIAQSASSDTVLLAAFAAIFWPAVIAIGYPWSRSGWIWLDDEGIRVTRHVGVEAYRWDDIDTVRVTTLGQHGTFYRVLGMLAGVSLNRQFVELHLRRAGKYGLGRSGSDVAGIPIGAKTVLLFADAPTEVLDAARALIEASGVYVGTHVA